MRVKLDLHDPSTHWIALARVIENNPDLPDDIVLVVRPHDVLLQEPNAPSGVGEIACGEFSENSVMDLRGKLAFLEWLHERFATSRR
jgi:hypothetical protein